MLAEMVLREEELPQFMKSLKKEPARAIGRERNRTR